MKQKIPWNRFTVEAIVIVGSILLAFAIDAWWEERLERELEQDYLSGFQADLLSDGGALGTAQRRIERAVFAAEHFLLLAGTNLNGHWNVLRNYESPTLQTEFDPSSPRWFSSALNFTPADSTYITIVSNGDLRTIQDRKLRLALISYYRTEDKANDDNAVLMSGITSLTDFLLENDIDLFNPDQSYSIPGLAGVIPYLSKARDQEHWRLSRLQNLQRNYDVVMAELDRVLAEK